MGDLTDRQQAILDLLRRHQEPLPGAEIATRFGVTRQVVVHDIALMRAQGENILSTPRGYLVPADRTDVSVVRTVLAVAHPPGLTEVELYTLVDHGIRVLDVIVEHPLYGELRGPLHLNSRRDVGSFLKQVNLEGALLLSSLTAGEHMHTVEYTDASVLLDAVAALRAAGVQVLD